MTDDHVTDSHQPMDDAAEALRPEERGAGVGHAHGDNRADAHGEHADAHGDNHAEHADAHADAHAHDEMSLGPVDVAAWGAGILGVALGLVTAFSFALSTGLIAS